MKMEPHGDWSSLEVSILILSPTSIFASFTWDGIPTGLLFDYCCLLMQQYFIPQVGEQTKPELIHCKCNHLTSFASDFLVAPNPIDFDKVFSADLSKNFVVLLVVCLIFGLYIMLVVIARRFDKKDLEKVGFAEISPARRSQL